MNILSFGFKKPQTGDKGGGVNGFWLALEADIQQLNDHTHNGSDSSLLSPNSINALTQTITSAGWVAFGTGYRQLVTMPGSALYDNFGMLFKDSTSKEIMHGIAVTKVSSNTYYVYCNDNSVGLTVYYVN